MSVATACWKSTYEESSERGGTTPILGELPLYMGDEAHITGISDEGKDIQHSSPHQEWA